MEKVRKACNARSKYSPTNEASRFLPNPLSTGYLHLSFPTHPPPQSHAPLSLVRPSHFPLAVIGVATCSESDSLNPLYSQFSSAVDDIFTSGSAYPLLRNCFVFEEAEGPLNLDPSDSLSGIIVVPRIANRKLHLGTLLGVLCSQILVEMGVLVESTLFQCYVRHSYIAGSSLGESTRERVSQRILDASLTSNIGATCTSFTDRLHPYSTLPEFPA